MGKYRNVQYLPSLNPLSVTQDIKVIVVRKFFVPTMCGVDSSMHIWIRDCKGNMCEAVIQPYQIPLFDSLLKVGYIYYISRFSVVEKKFIFLPSGVPFMLMLHHRTEVSVTVGDEFSRLLYHDTDFSVIKSVDYDVDSVVFDAFGAVVDCVVLPVSENEKTRMLVLLEGLGKKFIRIVLKDSLYVQFKSYVDHIWSRKCTFFVILNLFRPVLWNGDVVLESCKFMSDMVIDQTHPEIVQYRSRLSCNIKVSRRGGARVMAYPMEIISEELFGPDGSFLSLADLRTTHPVGKHWVIGKIQFVATDTNWYTTKCYRCKTKVPNTYSRVYCHVCCCYIVPNAQYMLNVHVVDGAGCAEFMLLDDTSYELIGRTADEVISDMLRVKAACSSGNLGKCECSDLWFPGDIHMIIGKEYVFKVEVGHDHPDDVEKTTYKVHRVTRCTSSLQLRLGSNSISGVFQSSSSSADDAMDE